MPQAEKNQRLYPRMSSAVSVKLQYLHDAKAINISEKGICLETSQPLAEDGRNVLSIQLDEKTVEAEFSVVWRENLEVVNPAGEKETVIRYGLSLEKLSDKHLERLLDAPFELKKIDPKFIALVKKFRWQLREMLAACDAFDEKNQGDSVAQARYIERMGGKWFAELDRNYKKVWKFLKNQPPEVYREHQHYIKFILGYYLELPRINRHICAQPFGYPGDFMIMNYIYDYQAGNYLGKNTYEKIINAYTCSTPVARSNIVRKDFIKNQILEVVAKKPAARILSLGGGPARELIEILKENWRGCAFHFAYLDFEKKAMEYVQKQIEGLYSVPAGVKIDYYLTDVVRLVKDRNLREKLGEFDFIYISGLFDYFSDKLCSHVLEKISRLVKENGQILVCNISNHAPYQRAYYETLGKWIMIHRDKKTVLGWARELRDAFAVKIVPVKKCPNYTFMEVAKE